MDASFIENVKKIAIAAGAEVLKHYGSTEGTTAKADDSPLTLADLASHRFILKSLRELTPDLPVLSEESEELPYSERKAWNSFWVVDPVDGTKEFIKQTGQFTINIALVEGGRSVLGVVYAPAMDLMYWASVEGGAFKQVNDGIPESIGVAVPNREALRIVASRDHAGPMVKALLERFPNAETKSMGSSLKFCLVAEGKADIYLRDVPTMEWDTAAAQCILESAGGSVQTLEGHRLTYNKEDLRNPLLVSLGDPSFDWK